MTRLDAVMVRHRGPMLQGARRQGVLRQSSQTCELLLGSKDGTGALVVHLEGLSLALGLQVVAVDENGRDSFPLALNSWLAFVF